MGKLAFEMLRKEWGMCGILRSENNLGKYRIYPDSHKILIRCNYYFSQLSNVYSVSDINQKNYIWLSEQYLDVVPYGLKFLSGIKKNTNCQVVIKFQQI
jgi:hypothetical protein